jgi:tripartite-type tricarboxylate transporter receptor subunit TctC
MAALSTPPERRTGIMRLAVRVLALAVVAVAPVASAQDAFPSRPISLVAPFPPGGVADLTARPVAAAMERVLENPVGVVNKTGAAGAVGMQYVATSRPDGYTLLLALSSISIIPEADKLFGRQPAFTVDQFAPIALVSADPTILVVRAESPWKTAREFIEDARKRPGQISFSSSGVYGTLHMAMELLSHAAGIKLRHVPYQGGGPALTAILGGHVDALASGPSVVLPHIKAGKLRALAGWGDTRVAALPEVPTFRELGHPAAEFYIWAGVFAPRDTPAPVLAKLRETMQQVVADPDFKAAMDKLQTPIVFKQGQEFQKFFEADARRLAEGVRRVGRIEEKK